MHDSRRRPVPARSARRGASLVEVLTGLAAAAVLTAVAAPALGGGQPGERAVGATGGPAVGPRSVALSVKDSAHLVQLHRAMIIFASESKGRMPRPGLIDRLPFNGLEIPGRGEEDVAANTTANLYSALIMQNYFDPRLVVSPVERNPKVTVSETFDYEAYSPADDRYWDSAFTADLTTGSNASYAHLVLAGERVKRVWNDGMLATTVPLGNRGPAEGARHGASFTTDPHGFWSGHLVFGDNHVELVREPAPSDDMTLPRTGDAPAVRDNVFAMETGPGGTDLVLAFTAVNGGANGPVRQYD